MANIKFEDYSVQVKATINDAITAFLYEASGELVSQTARNTPVDTGQLKGSWSYEVDESAGKAQIGSPLENAIWNEFGTGVKALHGDGRKTPWRYQDSRGEWHTTNGKAPRRSLQQAWDGSKGRLQAQLARILKEGVG